jgi:galactokinase
MTINELREQFLSLFPEVDAGAIRAIRAPGRVNLIGEHTDYNDGFVCPMAIDKSTLILCSPRNDAVVRMHSTHAQETAEFSIAGVVPKDGPAWTLYPKGAAEAMRQRAHIRHGMNALVASNVPLGGGLSSSASFEVATALALLTLNEVQMKPEEIALACQWAEHHYPGMPCGIMDQLISAMGKQGHALLVDCRSLATRQVPLDDPKLRIVISNTNVKHALVGGEYAARRKQCEAAVAFLKPLHPQITSLRDVTMEMLSDAKETMDPLTYQRAHHVVTEIGRTTAFADALGERDYVRCGKLMLDSHDSLRDDYAVSCAELDVLVEIARQVPGVFGARMTGGGFGGCIVALTTADAVGPLTQAIDREYPARANGKKATTFATVPSEGAHVENLT